MKERFNKLKCLFQPGNRIVHNVFKYVRKGHVQTGEHWTRHWKRARLVWELKQEKGGNR